MGVESESAGIVEDFHAVFEGTLGDFGLVGVQRKRGTQISPQAFQNGNKALPFLIRCNPVRSRLGGFRPDVDDIRALLFQFERAGKGAVGIVEASAVGERIGRDIQNTHDERALA